MPEIIEPPAPHCYRLLSGTGIAQYQSLDPDLFLHLQVRCAPVTAAQ
jgi:hypothetical protein